MVRFRKFIAPNAAAMQQFKQRMRNATLSFVCDQHDEEIQVLVSPFSSDAITDAASDCGMEEIERTTA